MLLALASCVGDSTAPSAPHRAQLTIGPIFDRQTFGQVGVDRVLVRFTRPLDGSKALETVVPFPTASDTLSLSVTVPVSGASEAFDLSILMIDDPAADTVFRSGPTRVTLDRSGPQANLSVPAFVYTGTGSKAVGVRFVTAPSQVSFGQSATFVAEAFDAAKVVIPNTPIVWTTSDSLKARVPVASVGTIVGGTTRGIANVTASLLRTSATTPPLSVSAPLIVQPVASTAVVVSGSGQSGTVGTPLAQPLRVRVNASDNLGVQGVAVSFAPTGGGGTLSASTVTTDANGDASVVWTLGAVPGQQTVTASAAGVSGAPAIFAATAVPGSATRLAFNVHPSSSTAGQSLAPAVVVVAQDALGNTVPGFSGAVTLGIGTNPSTGTLSGTTTVVAVAGVATFSNLVLNTAASGYTLTASAAGLSSATSSSFTITPAAAHHLQFDVQPANATAGVAITPAIQVSLRDANGLVVTASSAIVTLGIRTNPASGTLTGGTSVAAVNGVATFTGLSINNAGVGYVLEATSTSLPPLGSASFSILPAQQGGTPTTLAFVQQPTTVATGASITPAVTVAVRDANGNTVTSFTGSVTLAIGTNPGGATLSGSTTAPAVAGVATFSSLQFSAPGAGYTLIASSGSLAAATSVAFNVVGAGAPTQLAFAVQPSATTASSVVSPAVQVAIRDAAGNVVTSASGTVTIAIGTNPGGGTLAGTVSAAAINGVATFNNLSISTAGVGYTLTATSTGLTSATSVAFDITATSPQTLVFTSAPANTTAGSAFAPTIVVTAKDALGNVATGFTGAVTLAFGTNPGTATLSGTTTVTAVAGVATFSGITIAKAAAGYTLTATATGITATTSGAFTIAPAAASTLSFTTQPTTTSAGATLAPAVVVAAVDAFGNVATTFNGIISIAIGTNPGGATLTGTLSAGAVAGVATFSNLSLTTIGVGYTLSASATGLTAGTSAAFDVTANSLSWTNPSGGLWTNPSNWSLGRVPATTDSVIIALPGTYTVTLDTAFNASFLTVGGASGTQTLALTSRVLNVSGKMTVRANGVFTIVSVSVNGPGLVVNQGTLNMKASSFSSATTLDNQGLLIANQGAGSNGPFTTSAASIVRIQPDGTTGYANFATGASFTNNGLIEFTSISAAYSATLTVTGTVTNAAGGRITTLVGTGGSRIIDAQLNNLGTMTLLQPLTLSAANVAHTNSGTIDASAADWTLNQSGASASFTNTGAITLGSGRTWTINGGTLNQNGGTIGGPGTLSLNNLTANLTTSITNATTAFLANNVTINGPGTLTNAAGQTMSLKYVTVGATGSLDNRGTLITNGTVAVNGPFTTTTGSVLRVQSDGSTGFANFTTAGSFTNNGAIELTSLTAGYSALVGVAGANTLTNAAGATITSLVGTGGARTIDAQLANLGTVTLLQPLALTHPNAAHTNSGTIDATAIDWTLNQSGASASFTNTGTVTIGSGRTWTINGGTLNQSAGSIGGPGTLSLNSLTANLTTNITNATTAVVATGVTINGPGTLTNAVGQSMSLRYVTIGVTGALDNRGTLIANGTVAVNGPFTTTAGSILRVQSDGSTGFANFTTAGSFTNNGAIELTSLTAGYSALVGVAGTNTLTNAVGATITTLVGTGGPRTIDAQLNNVGTLTLLQPLSLNHADAAHTNSGTIDATAIDWTLNQSGTNPSFTNTGTVIIGSGKTWTINGGTLNQSAGSIGGPGTLSLNNLTANLTTNITNATTAVVASSVTINGPGTLTNAVGQSMSLKYVTIGATGALDNRGTLIANGTVAVNGPFTTTAGSVLRVQSDGSTGFANFTTAGSFTNNGAIELTSLTAGYAAQLGVAGSNTLTNAAGATITTLVGTGGPRTIDAQLNNLGTVTLLQPLALNHASAAHTNSGTVDVSTADLVLSQSGTSPSFTNSGTVTIGAGRTWSVNGGTLNQNAGTVGGAGTLALSSVIANFVTNFTNATTALNAVSVTFNGPGSLTNAVGQSMTLRYVTIGATSALDNRGTLIANGTVAVNGPFTTTSGSTLRLQADGSTGFSTFTTAGSFTNNGAIELTSLTSGYASTLAVAGTNTLTNAVGATITSLVGTGGPRTLDAQLNNAGTLTINQPLSLNHASAAHTNSGTIDASAGDFSIDQSGPSPSFSNTSTGTISSGAGHTITVNGGTFTQGGALSGAGTLTLNNVASSFNNPVAVAALNVTGGTTNLAFNLSTATTAVTLTSLTLSGPGTLTNAVGQTMTLKGVTIGASSALDNRGTLIANSSVTVNGPFTTTSGSTLRLQPDGSTGFANFTTAGGFTNNGAIELTSLVSGYSATLAVGGSNTLTNAAGSTITSLVGTGGPRTLDAQLNNLGTVTVLQPLLMNHSNAAHTNGGTVDASGGDLSINQSGTSPGFTNTSTGTMTVGAGRTLAISNGTFTQGGTLNGGGTLTLNTVTSNFNNAFTLGALNVTGGAATFATNLSTNGLALNLSGTSVNGPGTITNPAGQTLSIQNVTINTDLINQGTLIADGSATVSAAKSFTSAAGSTLRLKATGSTGFSTFTAAPFTNAGAIELTSSVSGYSATLNVSGTGILTNAPTGTITSLVGTGGPRTLGVQLDNQGLLTVNQPLTINRSSSLNANSGTIDMTAADLTINQSGTSPSFTNTSSGTLTVGAGRTLTLTNGSFTQGGTLNGGGALSLSTVTSNFSNPFTLSALTITAGSATFATNVSTSALALNLAGTTINGPGTITNPAGKTLSVQNVSFNTDLINQGTLITDGSTTVAAAKAFTTAAGSTLRIQATGATGFSTFTAAPFTNAGTIELTSSVSGYSATLNVSGAGNLTNAAGGTIAVLTGTGGPRAIGAQVNNQGALTVHPGTGVLQVTGSLTSSGALNMELGGTTPGAGYSQIAVTGPATLSGTLNFSLVNAFTPASLTAFNILTSSGLTGTLAVGTQPGGWAAPTYPANTVRLTAP